MNESNKIKYFEYIPSKPNESMILTRLGYQKTTTVFSDEYKEKLNEIIKSGILLCNTKGVFGRYEIIEKSEKYVKLENGVVFESASLAKLLNKSIEVVLMASTVGKEITDKIHFEVESGDASLGVILDSVASQTADAALNWMVDFINKLIRREGKSLTRTRYSPGYGDLPLINQKKIFDTLGLEKLGLNITERYMLLPEKSVIAIAGIEGIDSDE
ncbi:vitamin B12 dependent-methionine synthase activation domain-containing protein [Acetivibrio cellulolyticus]|uniref:vitamin B12 dependent-methionine synthase activation domain-containing protein n=1 Tax=Acetivibrio cellulolyticus TaxID=35830 RepID=UPI0001E2D0EC|nr:vitamin B12 dependent-methionine synthase activation domain-containing protein [Acetivibrio cellulolyticus]